MPKHEPLRSMLITGSGSGIGAATALRLAQPGVGMLIHALHNSKGCEQVAAEVRARGAEAIVMLGDLAERGTAAELVDQTVKSFGGLNVVIANAGFPLRRLIGELDRAELDHCLSAITGSFFELMTAAHPHLRNAADARAVATSTHNAHVFRPDYPVYPASGAAKAGLEAMVRAVAVQFAADKITVNAVVPGLIRKTGEQFLTEREWREFALKVPLGRIGEPEEVAALIAFLVSTESSYITGQMIHVNGGLV
jgi:NAD(P)-dependent dehydrogenase (short-subunit alcohol dehydrogenase family)